MAGVSTATVSRALSRPETVAEGTRLAVIEAARMAGYRINVAARNLRRRETGAIVVLILFVMMLLGVDRREDVVDEPLPAQRAAAVMAGLSFLGIILAVLILGGETAITGAPASLAAIATDEPNIDQIGRLLFTDYVFAFELTAALLTIAVVGAVVLARRPTGYEPIGEQASLDLPPLEPDDAGAEAH